jgi:hypothetical protein
LKCMHVMPPNSARGPHTQGAAWTHGIDKHNILATRFEAYTGRQAGRQADRGRQASKQASKQADRGRQASRHAGKQTDTWQIRGGGDMYVVAGTTAQHRQTMQQ